MIHFSQYYTDEQHAAMAKLTKIRLGFHLKLAEKNMLLCFRTFEAIHFLDEQVRQELFDVYLTHLTTHPLSTEE